MRFKIAVIVALVALAGGIASAETLSRRQLREWTNLLHSDDPLKRSSAATSLLASGDQKALDALLEGMKDDQPEGVRISIITSFGVKGDDRAMAQLIDALNDPSEAVRKASAAALASITTLQAFQRLAQTIADDSKPLRVRTEAILVLGNMRSLDAVPVLIDELSDKAEQVRIAARASLEKITLRNYETPKEWREWWDRSSKMSREELLEDLVTLQADKIKRLEHQVDKLYLDALADRKDPNDPAPLVAAINESGSSAVKIFAAKALSAIKNATPETRGALVGMLKDPDPAVRIAAVNALGTLGDTSLVDLLVPLLSDESAKVRATAAQALGNLKAKAAVPVLCRLLDDPVDEAAVAAANALGEIADPDAIVSLIRIVNGNTNVSSGLYDAALGALAKIKDARTSPTWIALLSSDKEKARWAAVNALGNLKDTNAIKPLSDLALNDQNSRMREEAVAALGKIGSSAAAPALIGALGDKEKRVSEQAMRSLTQLADADPSLYGTILDRLLSDGKYDMAEAVVAGSYGGRGATNNTPETSALKRKLAEGFIGVKQWAKARPYIEALLTKPTKDPGLFKDLAACLQGQEDYPGLLALSAQARAAAPDDSAYWWQQSAQSVEQLLAKGQYSAVVAAVDALEKEDPAMGGPSIAVRLRDARDQARVKLQPVAPPVVPAPKPPDGGNPAEATKT